MSATQCWQIFAHHDPSLIPRGDLILFVKARAIRRERVPRSPVFCRKCPGLDGTSARPCLRNEKAEEAEEKQKQRNPTRNAGAPRNRRLLSSASMPFHATENTIACNTLVVMRVDKPRTNKPFMPSFSRTPLTAPMYPKLASPGVCFTALTTRNELGCNPTRWTRTYRSPRFLRFASTPYLAVECSFASS